MLLPKRWIIGVLIVAICTGIGMPASAQMPGVWHTTTVDGGLSADPLLGDFTSLMFDSTGNPGIGYRNTSGHSLKYAYRDGSGWHNATADSSLSGRYCSLAFGSSGFPGVSYRDDDVYDLKYAYVDQNGWHNTTVDSEGQTGYFTSLAIDGAGFPHISYYDFTNGDLKYAYMNGSDWHTVPIDTAGNVGLFTSIVLDDAGFSHVSYVDATKGNLKYAFVNVGGWQEEIADTGVGVGMYSLSQTSLALDKAGYPHISYTSDSSALRYSWKNATGWHSTTVDDMGACSSLALDSAGFPHISYFNSSGFDLKYAWQNETGWHTMTLDSDGTTGLATSLRLDTADFPHISYYDGSAEELRYAWYSETPVINAINPGFGTCNTLTAITSLSGAGFLPGSVVYLNRTGQADIPATNVTVSTSKEISCNIPIPADAALGAWDVVVTNPDGLEGRLPGGFTIRQEIPTGTTVFSSLNPSMVGDTVIFTAFVSGSEGTGSETVTFTDNGNPWPGSEDIPLNSTGAADVTRTDLPPGTHNITALYSGNLSMASSTGFLDPQIVYYLETTPITLTSSKNPSPAGYAVTFTAHVSGRPGSFSAFSAPLSVNGYVPTDSVQFSDNGVAVGIPVPLDPSGNATYTNSTLLPGNHIITAMYGGNGTWQPGTGTLAGNQTVNPLPAISSITPKTGRHGTTVTVKRVTGMNFQSNAGIVLTKPGLPEIPGKKVRVVSPVRITCTFRIPAGAQTGFRNVTVTNPDGGNFTMINGFKVTS